MQKRLNPTQCPGASTERFRLDAESLQDGDKEVGQGKFFRFYFASPAGIGNDSSAGLIVFVSFAEFEETAILESEVFTPGRNNRVIAREMKAAGSRAVHGKRVIQHVSPARRFRGVL